MPVNCLELTQNDIRAIMSAVLYQFPVKEICVDFPRWILSLEKDHWLRQELVSSILDHAQEIVRIRDVEEAQQRIVVIIRDLEERSELIILKGGKDDIIA